MQGDVTGAVYLIRPNAGGEIMVTEQFQEGCLEELDPMLELEIRSSNLN